MLEAITIQLENNRCQQKQIRKYLEEHSLLASIAKNKLRELTKEQILPRENKYRCKRGDECIFGGWNDLPDVWK